jgi:hypothetical protein
MRGKGAARERREEGTGLAHSLLEGIATVAVSRPELATVAPPPGRDELLTLLEADF